MRSSTSSALFFDGGFLFDVLFGDSTELAFVLDGEETTVVEDFFGEATGDETGDETDSGEGSKNKLNSSSFPNDCEDLMRIGDLSKDCVDGWSKLMMSLV